MSERGSVVDAQIELDEQIRLELERCKDVRYYFMYYWLIEGRKPKIYSPELLQELIDYSNGTSTYT